MFEQQKSGTVAVIGAMEQEIELLKSQMEHLKTEYFGKY